MISKCKDQITNDGKLWDQDKPSLVANMQQSVLLARTYKEHYKAAKEQLAGQPKSKQFDFDEQVHFWEGEVCVWICILCFSVWVALRALCRHSAHPFSAQVEVL